MEQKTKEKLTRSSNAITHYLFQQDDNGLIELTPKAAAISIIIVTVIFLAFSAWAG